MKKTFNTKKAWRPASIYKLISDIRSQDKRNLVRGLSVRSYLTPDDVAAIRRGNSSNDNVVIGGILKNRYGLLSKRNETEKKTSDQLFNLISFPALDSKNEVPYTAGYVNSMAPDAILMLGKIAGLSRIELMQTDAALDSLFQLSKKYGASNYLSYKLAYVRSSRDLTPDQLNVVVQIEEEFRHRDNAGLHFSALENISSKISLLVVTQRRISALVGRVDGNFRKSFALSNFIPTPLDYDDVSGFLLRATESCLLDTVHAILVIFNLSQDLDSAKKDFELRLRPDVLAAVKSTLHHATSAADGEVVTDYYREQSVDGADSSDLYRISAAFLERPKYALYRNTIDRVIGARLLAEIIGHRPSVGGEPLNDKASLLQPNSAAPGASFPISLDAFYRTFLFLKFIAHRPNILLLTTNDIKFIFENTVWLEVLLSEDEIQTLYQTAPEHARSLVAVLALALYRKKSIDPDVDFEFRTDFIAHVKSQHHGSIVDFINYLLQESPQVASYIAASLDEVTLEKLYSLVTNSSQAAQVRGDILRAVGQKLNRIEYIIEADAITTRSKVSKLQKYFDSSRMYVDSVSMKKWLDSNPTIATEQYRALYPRMNAKISALELERGGDANVVVIKIDIHDEYLISQIAKDAFEQFCLNNEFGIQSYLGRRIRHNTLDGVTTDTVDAVLRKPEYGAAMANQHFRRTVEAWMGSYKAIIDKLRRENLQFKSSSSLFKSTLDLDDPTTKENLRVLSSTLRSAGGSELLNDMVIAFCWLQIAPQLESAGRFIKTNLLREANAALDKHFFGYYGTIEGQIKSELHEAVNEVFKKVADWFQIPQTGFISASMRDLCQIILIDLNRPNSVKFSGDAVEVKYTGISVHRLYDCLAVLLQNAYKHGETDIPIEMNLTRMPAGATLDQVSVEISSVVAEDEYENSKTRILRAIESDATGTDMVTEGYTGIKKIKFITRASEGRSTARCDANDLIRTLKIGFSIHAETATEEPAK